MSAKWVRSQQWDDQFFPPWAFPAKWLLRAFSSIWLAVLLLALVGVFGILASVPIGMIALIPTVMLYALTFLGVAVMLAGAPVALGLRGLGAAGVGRAGRFTFAVLGGLGLFILSAWCWWQFVWPSLRYSETTGAGVRLFAEFVREYQSLPLRRLPGMEMSELEFYAWWPLELILMAFVANMVIATVRRIEFSIEKLGVLMVHTGIVTIALGSVYYSALKQEGDVVLAAGTPDERGQPTPGQPVEGFFDNTQTVLWISQGRGMEQRALRNLPRYNSYALAAAGAPLDRPAPTQDEGRTLSIPVPDGVPPGPGREPLVDPDLRFRVVGYADYTELADAWTRADPAASGQDTSPVRELRSVEIFSAIDPTSDAPPGTGPERLVRAIRLAPDSPADRFVLLQDAVGVEFTRGMDEARWKALQAPLPQGVRYALLVEVPASAASQVVPIDQGQTLQVAGYTLQIEGIQPRPELPIITKGYEGAPSSLAMVRVTPPAPPGGAATISPTSFTRYVYHRFPEIAQDLSDELTPRGSPKRGPADPAIKITLIDASMVQVYIDEQPAPAPSAGQPTTRALVRLPGAGVQAYGPFTPEQLKNDRPALRIAPMISLRVTPGAEPARRAELPVIVPKRERERDNIGNHRKAAIAVEVSLAGQNGAPPFRRVIWLPFAQYINLGQEYFRSVALPDGRAVSIAFGRRYHPFPDMALQLLDFQMFPYPHSDAPRDFRSDLRVIHGWRSKDFKPVDRATSLNDPLLVRIPFEWSGERPWLANAVGALVSSVAPNQYKFSQVSWDANGWRTTKQQADAGQIPRPLANFTILGVGNNPGIYIIAAGAVLMSVGIPYAFYLKPWILRRKKQAIQRALARGEYTRPNAPKARSTERDGSAVLAAGRGQQ